MTADGKDERMGAALDAKAAVEGLAEMARTLAHDLNQPLAAASNYLAVARQAARKQAPDSPGLVESLEKAAMQVTRATEAVRRMRASLAPGEPEMTEQSLHRLIRRACASLENADRKFDLSLAAADDSVLADPAQIGDALLRLLRAASESAGGGEDSVATIATSSNSLTIQAEITVSGSGRNQPIRGASAANALESLLARRILETHGGSLERQPGAVVRLILPLATSGEE